jgi:hypothetical protein
MPAAKPIRVDSNFDDAMRKLMRIPPPPSGKKAKRKAKKASAKKPR